MISTHWSFNFSAWFIVVTSLAWVISIAASWLQWQRRGRGKRVLSMEILRLLIVTLICIMLFKPELVKEIPRTQSPHVVILTDASGSMLTRDVTLDDKTVVTRADWLKANNTDAHWKPISDKGKVTIENFAAPPVKPSADAGTDLNDAVMKLLTHEDNLKALLVLTDGDWNIGDSPVVAATKFSARDIPIYSVGIGGEQPLPDLVLEHSSTPAYGILGDQITIPFKIQSYLSRQVDTTVTMSDMHGVVSSKAITIPAFGQVSDSLVWMPTEAADYDLQVKLPVEADEAIQDNNTQDFRMSVRAETLNVLVVESAPRWEYRYLRNALQRDPGVHVETLLFHPGMPVGTGRDYIPAFPSSKEQLSKFDVVFLGDVGLGGGELSQTDLEGIHALVEQQGSGLVFMPGQRGRELSLVNSPVGDMLPVDFDASKPAGNPTEAESQIILTSEGRGSLLTMLSADETTNGEIWKNLPGFYWSAAVTKSRPGSEVLAVHSTMRTDSGRIPILVTRPFGNGKVLFMGTDGAWRWRKGVEDKYHYRFWGQVVRWMSHQRHLAAGEHIRMSFSPENPRTGDTVFLLATVFDNNGFPIDKGNVSAQVAAPDGSSEHIDLTPVPGGWGVYKTDFVPRVGGKFEVTVSNDPGGQKITAPVLVEQPTVEKVGQPGNFAVLREMSEITHGASGNTSQLDEIVKRISLLPEPKPVEKRFRLWSEWWSGATLVFLLAGYWTFRKLSGMV